MTQPTDNLPDLDEIARQPWPMPGQSDLAGLTCPPCTGNCRQGRDCDAEREGEPLALFVGIRNALLLTLAAVGVWHIVSLVLG